MQVNVNSNISGGGVSISTLASRTVDSATGAEPALPAGKLVTSWVKTDATTAACNLPAGHGYTTGNFDVFWTEAGVPKRRYKVAGTIAGNVLSPLGGVGALGGTGDAFPATGATDVVVTRQIQVNLFIDGDLLSVLALNNRVATSQEGARGSVAFYDVGNLLIAQVNLPAPAYDIAGGASNPFTGTPITYALCSNGISTADGVLQIVIGQDSTP